MKRIVLFIVVISSLLIDIKVNAKEIYYTNDYNVSFSKEEYDFISNFIFDGYQSSINKKEFNNLFNNINTTSEIKSVEYESEDLINLLSTAFHETTSKKLTLKSVCTGTICSISITNEWKKLPVVRSYDVIGMRTDGFYYPETVLTKVFNGASSTTYYDCQSFDQGFGVSVKLPTGNEVILVTQTFTMKKDGRVYASYQHAKNSVTLSQSKKYTISYSGYGGVFQFDSTVRDKYDNMQGIHIDV